MNTPPTWRALTARARRLGVTLEHGRHEATIKYDPDGLHGDWNHFTSWVSRRADSIILRTAIAAALEQLEAVRAAARPARRPSGRSWRWR